MTGTDDEPGYSKHLRGENVNLSEKYIYSTLELSFLYTQNKS